MTESCPVCLEPARCKGYAHLWRRLRENPGLWGPIHDRRNGQPPGAVAVRPVAESLALLALMHACPDREERLDCACGGLAACRRGRGRDGLVNHRDCFACLADVDGK